MEVRFEKPPEASFFFLENLSTAPLMKHTCGVKGVTLLAVRLDIRGNLGSKMGLIRKRAKISFCELEFKNQ